MQELSKPGDSFSRGLSAHRKAHSGLGYRAARPSSSSNRVEEDGGRIQCTESREPQPASKTNLSACVPFLDRRRGPGPGPGGGLGRRCHRQ